MYCDTVRHRVVFVHPPQNPSGLVKYISLVITPPSVQILFEVLSGDAKQNDTR